MVNMIKQALLSFIEHLLFARPGTSRVSSPQWLYKVGTHFTDEKQRHREVK